MRLLSLSHFGMPKDLKHLNLWHHAMRIINVFSCSWNALWNAFPFFFLTQSHTHAHTIRSSHARKNLLMFVKDALCFLLSFFFFFGSKMSECESNCIYILCTKFMLCWMNLASSFGLMPLPAIRKRVFLDVWRNKRKRRMFPIRDDRMRKVKILLLERRHFVSWKKKSRRFVIHS